MPRLIHLNGPSRVGKSTLARRFANAHPGTLVLDLDVLAGLVGGWKADFSAALDIARGLGRELAVRHLQSGYDVIFPQLVTVHDDDPDAALADVARMVDATYVHVALLVDDREGLQRLKNKRPSTEVEAHVQAVLTDPDSDLILRIRAHLHEYLRTRPDTIQIDTTNLTEEEAYALLVEALRAE